jgi:hypothetical protein
MLLPSKWARRIKVVGFSRCSQFPNLSQELTQELGLKSQFATSNFFLFGSHLKNVAQTALGSGGEDPVEGEDAEEPGSAGFAVPAAGGISAGDFFVAEHFHGVGFGEGDVAALLLQIDIFAVFGAFEDDSVG